MRRLLVDHARQHNAAKRGSAFTQVPLEAELAWIAPLKESSLDLSRALDELQELNPGKAQAVELRYFLGCTVEEAAALLGVSPSSIDRDIRFLAGVAARAVLHPYALTRFQPLMTIYAVLDMSSTSQEYFARLDRLFQEAVDLPEGEKRDEFLKISSGTDPDLDADVLRLLERDRLVRQGAVSSAQPLPRFGKYHAREADRPRRHGHGVSGHARRRRSDP
jgi:hypothetical protein